MLGTLKVTQDNFADKWANVPLQDFTESSDIDWSKSIPDIDKQLYKKYGLSVSNSIIFDKSLVASSLKFESKEFSIDDSSHQFKIRLDHHAKEDDSIYIFDSKYYFSVSDLNYKQFSYNEILRGGISKSTKMYSALILPSNLTCSNLHFSLSPAYLGARKTGTKIIEQYLNIKEVMQTFILN